MFSNAHHRRILQSAASHTNAISFPLIMLDALVASPFFAEDPTAYERAVAILFVHAIGWNIVFYSFTLHYITGSKREEPDQILTSAPAPAPVPAAPAVSPLPAPALGLAPAPAPVHVPVVTTSALQPQPLLPEGGGRARGGSLALVSSPSSNTFAVEAALAAAQHEAAAAAAAAGSLALTGPASATVVVALVATAPAPAADTDSAGVRAARLASLRQALWTIFVNPNMVAIAVSLVIALWPALKSQLFTQGTVLRPAMQVVEFLGGGAVPLGSLVMAGNVAESLKRNFGFGGPKDPEVVREQRREARQRRRKQRQQQRERGNASSSSSSNYNNDGTGNGNVFYGAAVELRGLGRRIVSRFSSSNNNANIDSAHADSAGTAAPAVVVAGAASASAAADAGRYGQFRDEDDVRGDGNNSANNSANSGSNNTNSGAARASASFDYDGGSFGFNPHTGSIASGGSGGPGTEADVDAAGIADLGGDDDYGVGNDYADHNPFGTGLGPHGNAASHTTSRNDAHGAAAGLYSVPLDSHSLSHSLSPSQPHYGRPTALMTGAAAASAASALSGDDTETESAPSTTTAAAAGLVHRGGHGAHGHSAAHSRGAIAHTHIEVDDSDSEDDAADDDDDHTDSSGAPRLPAPRLPALQIAVALAAKLVLAPAIAFALVGLCAALELTTLLPADPLLRVLLLLINLAPSAELVLVVVNKSGMRRPAIAVSLLYLYQMAAVVVTATVGLTLALALFY